jgi:hypothetical protein
MIAGVPYDRFVLLVLLILSDEKGEVMGFRKMMGPLM